VTQKTEKLLPVLTGQPVIPVVRIADARLAAPLARTLVAAGLPAIEITLRTPAALDAIREASAVGGAIIGAGTVLNPADFADAEAAGARFIVSPGATASLMDAAAGSSVPLLPGAVTPSEIMTALDCGYSVLKFFPAGQAGGSAYLKALSSPFSRVRFCPTGDIGPDNAPAYLNLPNVICVGGSWMTPDTLLEAGDWEAIGRLAREAASLSRPGR
jgi:2-dehydro-3-deoxyphosphogluconate aldolase/(4S)-4-hydroxy-2-oxoglutarate aldolase